MGNGRSGWQTTGVVINPWEILRVSCLAVLIGLLVVAGGISLIWFGVHTTALWYLAGGAALCVVGVLLVVLAIAAGRQAVVWIIRSVRIFWS